ncbi:MAG: hypothetical protein H0V21_04065 [Rubrobacter sp.]|nr:hypothetical protein [Rubrobacter sp.]
MARAWSASLAVLQGLAAAVLSTLVFGWWVIPPLVAAAWWLRRKIGRPGFVGPAPESSQGEPCLRSSPGPFFGKLQQPILSDACGSIRG